MYHTTSNWLGEPTRVRLEPYPDEQYDRMREEEDAMPHHFPKLTVEAACWCNRCNRETPWRIADGRRQFCLICRGQSKPPAVAKPQSNQMSFWTKAGK